MAAASECVLGMWQSEGAELFLCLARDAQEAGGSREMLPQKLRGGSVSTGAICPKLASLQASPTVGTSTCHKELLACNPGETQRTPS